MTPTGFVQTVPAGDGSQRVTVTANQELQGVTFANRQAVPPVVRDDLRSTRVNTPIVINVLANDEAGDSPLDPTTVNIVLNPTSGTAAVDPVNGRITYTPAADFVGQVSLRYTVRDTEDIVSNEATVGIQVSNLITPWQNPLNPLDVDNDISGNVFAIDALLVINELNEPQYRNPVTGELPPPPDPVPYYFDVSGDNMATPFDALLIINYLNSLTLAAKPATAAMAAPREAEPTITSQSSLAAALAADAPIMADGVVVDDADVGLPSGDESLACPADEALAGEWQSLFDTSASGGTASNQKSTAGLDEELLGVLAEDLAGQI